MSRKTLFGLEDGTEHQKLCTVCRRIVYQKLVPPWSWRLHASLEELRDCKVECFLCDGAYSGIMLSRAQRDKDWQDESRLRFYEARLSLDTSTIPPTGEMKVIVCSRPLLWSDPPSGQIVRISDVDDEIGMIGSVHTDEGDPAASVVPAIRKVGENTASSETLALARFWLSTCVAWNCAGLGEPHKAVGFGYGGWVRAGGAYDRPKRLLETHEDGARLRLRSGDQNVQPYVALSYVWGVRAAEWITTKANLMQRTIDFALAELPKTLADAVSITQLLGYRLLWVDSLCIVQDDQDEWRQEASKMASIYKHAVVTIVAGASGDSHTGMFNSQSFSAMETSQHIRLTNRLDDGTKSTLYLVKPLRLDRDADFNHSPPSGRAWCCQERVVSPRKLHFCNGQLHWECLHRSLAEDNIVRDYSRSRISNMIFFDDSNGQKPDVGQWLRAWYVNFIAADYSERSAPGSLSIPKDKLNAVAGIAALFHKLRPERYFAGHWAYNLIGSLCWKSEFGLSGQSKNAEAFRVPTWSWASQETPVRWDAGCLDNLQADAVIIAAEAEVQPTNPFGEISGGSLRLLARGLRGQPGPTHLGSCELRFENGAVEVVVLDDMDEQLPSDLTACLIGTVDEDKAICNAFSLVLRQDGTLFRRVGMIETRYSPQWRGLTSSIIHGKEEPDFKRKFDWTEFVIV